MQIWLKAHSNTSHRDCVEKTHQELGEGEGGNRYSQVLNLLQTQSLRKDTKGGGHVLCVCVWKKGDYNSPSK
jgi:hypothetical protein